MKRIIGAGFAIATVLVVTWEGIRYIPYNDVGNIPTVCYGHTGSVENRSYTKAECYALLNEDLQEAWDVVDKYTIVYIPEYEQAAFASLIYNIGETAFKNSTLLKKLNKNDHIGACNELLRWTRVKGKVVQGLVNRRMAERKVCLGL